MKSPRFVTARKVTATVCAGLCVGGSLLVAPAIAAAITFDSGHIDMFNVTADDSGSLTLNLKEDITGSHVTWPGDDVVIDVPDFAYTDSTNYIAGIDRPTWLLPQTQASDLPWPGWDTNGVRNAGFGSIDINLIEVSGPGTIFLYQQDTFGGTMSVTTDGSVWIDSGSVINQASPAHVHANWGFDEPGTYTITAVAGGHNNQGNYIESNVATYTFEVGDAGSSSTRSDSNAGNSGDGSAAQSGEESHNAGSASGSSNSAGSAGSRSAGSAASSTGSHNAGTSSNGRSNAAHNKSASNRNFSASRAASPAAASRSNRGSTATYEGDTALAADEQVSYAWAWWTWLLLVIGIAALTGGGWFLYSQIRRERRAATSLPGAHGGE